MEEYEQPEDDVHGDEELRPADASECREYEDGGADRTAQRVARGVDLWAFLMDELGVEPPKAP